MLGSVSGALVTLVKDALNVADSLASIAYHGTMGLWLMRRNPSTRSEDIEYGRLNAREFSQLLSCVSAVSARKAQAGTKSRGLEALQITRERGGPLVGLLRFAVRSSSRACIEVMLCDEETQSNPLEAMNSEGRCHVLTLLIGIGYSVEAIGYYGLSINEMLARIHSDFGSRLSPADSLPHGTIGFMFFIK
jgi:hypothetical protein